MTKTYFTISISYNIVIHGKNTNIIGIALLGQYFNNFAIDFLSLPFLPCFCTLLFTSLPVFLHRRSDSFIALSCFSSSFFFLKSYFAAKGYISSTISSCFGLAKAGDCLFSRSCLDN